MLLTITCTLPPATDLGFLLHKHPERVQSFELSFGKAHVFYPEASDARCTAALLLDVDPVAMVRGRQPGGEGLLDQYVNDRPYVASSFMSDKAAATATQEEALEARVSLHAHRLQREDLQGRASRRVYDFALYGETSSETDEFGILALESEPVDPRL